MTNKEKAMRIKVRLNAIRARGKNHDCPGVERKLVRQLRNLGEE